MNFLPSQMNFLPSKPKVCLIPAQAEGLGLFPAFSCRPRACLNFVRWLALNLKGPTLPGHPDPQPDYQKLRASCRSHSPLRHSSPWTSTSKNLILPRSNEPGNERPRATEARLEKSSPVAPFHCLSRRHCHRRPLAGQHLTRTFLAGKTPDHTPAGCPQ